MENRGKMPVSQRAKQFMPFSALTGLQEALERKERELGRISRPVISEENAEMINAGLLNLDEGDTAGIRYFKDGEMLTVNGRVEMIDLTFHRIEIGGVRIKTDDIVEICRGDSG